jgi:hypothetical protein
MRGFLFVGRDGADGVSRGLDELPGDGRGHRGDDPRSARTTTVA